MEKYIITFEDGTHYVATEITEEDEADVRAGILTIVRCSDAKELNRNGEWCDLLNWWQFR